MVRAIRLNVFLGDECIGYIDDLIPPAFRYAPTWLARDRPLALAAIPLSSELQQGDAVQAFFENLLPEGELRDYVAGRKKASTLFSLLLETAGDTAGAFVIVPDGQHPEAAQYEPSSWSDWRPGWAGRIPRPSISMVPVRVSPLRVRRIRRALLCSRACPTCRVALPLRRIFSSPTFDVLQRYGIRLRMRRLS